MVYRVYAEKKKEFAHEAKALLTEATKLLGVKGLTDIRILNRYDAENIRPELFEYAKTSVFSEPQVDTCTEAPDLEGAKVFAVEADEMSSPPPMIMGRRVLPEKNAK